MIPPDKPLRLSHPQELREMIAEIMCGAIGVPYPGTPARKVVFERVDQILKLIEAARPSPSYRAMKDALEEIVMVRPEMRVSTPPGCAPILSFQEIARQALQAEYALSHTEGEEP